MKRGIFILLLLFAAYPAWGASATLVVGKARQEVELTGYTRSKTEVTLSSEVSGKVLAVAYEVGDVVGTEPFVQIDPTFVDYSIKLARRAVEQLDAALAQNDSRVGFLRREFARIDTLYRNKSAPQQRRDQIRQDLDQAALERRSLLARKAAEQTRLAELLERRKRHDIYSPAGWRVSARNVDPGEIVTPSMQLAVVGDYRRLVVPLSVTPAELAAIRSLGNFFTVRLDSRKAQAQIRWVNPQFNERTRKVSIELLIAEWTGEHRGGLVMRLPVAVPAPGLSVPKAAVVNRYENPRVRLKDTGEEVPVLVLGETNSHLRIAENPKLRPGMALKPATP
jgi:multidrug efflux pump subunit AcrA (membrane-fusion protein)